jgi:hypothetical protein
MTPTPNPNDVLKDFSARLDRAGIAYMLTGSMAMMHYAKPRFTADIDVVIELNSEQALEISRLFEPDYYVPHGHVRQAALRKSMFNLIHQETLFKVDCIVKKETDFQRAAFENRRRVDYAGFETYIVAKEDLIVSKLLWAKDSHSEFQLKDVENLLKSGYNADYVNAWTTKLGIEALFEECLTRLKKPQQQTDE